MARHHSRRRSRHREGGFTACQHRQTPTLCQLWPVDYVAANEPAMMRANIRKQLQHTRQLSLFAKCGSRFEAQNAPQPCPQIRLCIARPTDSGPTTSLTAFRSSNCHHASHCYQLAKGQCEGRCELLQARHCPLASPRFHFSSQTVAHLSTQHDRSKRRAAGLFHHLLFAVPLVYGELLRPILVSKVTACVRTPCALCHGSVPLASGCGPNVPEPG